MQNRVNSLWEAVSNTALAFFISLLAHKYLVAPELAAHVDGGGDQETWRVAAAVTGFYTILSIGRNYMVRRIWENEAVRRTVYRIRNKLQGLHGAILAVWRKKK